MDKKVGKEKGEKKEEYIFQKNSITKTATFIVAVFLILLIIAVVVSKYFF